MQFSVNFNFLSFKVEDSEIEDLAEEDREGDHEADRSVNRQRNRSNLKKTSTSKVQMPNLIRKT